MKYISGYGHNSEEENRKIGEKDKRILGKRYNLRFE